MFEGSNIYPFNFIFTDRKKAAQKCLLTRENGRKLVQTSKDANDESKVIKVTCELIEPGPDKRFMVMVRIIILYYLTKLLINNLALIELDSGISRCDWRSLF